MHVEQAIQQAEAVFRFTQEVDRRLAEHGIAGTGELLVLWRELREALDRLSLPELDWASQEAARLQERLRELGGELAHLTALKAAFEVSH
jgi:hypothetical protein